MNVEKYLIDLVFHHVEKGAYIDTQYSAYAILLVVSWYWYAAGKSFTTRHINTKPYSIVFAY